MAKSVPYSERKFDHQKFNKYCEQYRKENYDRINVLFPKGTKEEVKIIADSLGIGISDFIRQAVQEKIDRLSEK